MRRLRRNPLYLSGSTTKIQSRKCFVALQAVFCTFDKIFRKSKLVVKSCHNFTI